MSVTSEKKQASGMKNIQQRSVKGFKGTSEAIWFLGEKHRANKYKWQVFTMEATNGTSVGEHVKHLHGGKYKSDAFHTPSPGTDEQTNSWPGNAGECHCFSLWMMWVEQSTCCSGPWHEMAMVCVWFPWQSLTRRSSSPTPAGRAGLSAPSLLFPAASALSRCFSQPFFFFFVPFLPPHTQMVSFQRASWKIGEMTLQLELEPRTLGWGYINTSWVWVRAFPGTRYVREDKFRFSTSGLRVLGGRAISWRKWRILPFLPTH